MEFNFAGFKDPTQSRLDNYTIDLQQINIEANKERAFLTAQLAEINRKLSQVEVKRSAAIKERQAQQDSDLAKIQEQKVKALEAEATKLREETVDIVKRIASGLPAFDAAREYQLEDIVQIIHEYRNGSSGILNANEMALGKTFESLVALYIIIELHKQEHGKSPTILWLTKSTIVETGGTFNEAKRWFPNLKMYPLKGSDNKSHREFVFDIAKGGGICVLTNYEAIRTTKNAQKIHWDIVVMDEVHKLKGGANPSGPTAVWTSIKDLNKGFTMMLSGTPLVNRIEEIWSYLHIFDAEAFPSSKEFSQGITALRDISGKMHFNIGSSSLVNQILRGRLIRRTAKEVGLQLPEVVEQIVWLQHNPEQGVLYEQMKEQFFIWLDKQEKHLSATSILAQLIRLRQINVLPVANFQERDENGFILSEFKLEVRDSSKLDEAVDIITNTGDQVIVGCNFNEPMEELALRLQVEGLHPEIISSDYRKEMAAFEVGFQNKDIDVLLINLAMGEGMNLHKDSEKWPGGARAVIFLDKWYNNARNDQFMKRAVRPGKNAGEPVFIYDLKVENSVDLYIQALCDAKSEQFDSITEDKTFRPAADWKQYLRKMI